MLTARFSRQNGPLRSQWNDFSTDSDWIFTSNFGEVSLKKRNPYPGTFAWADDEYLCFGYGNGALAQQILDRELSEVSFEQFYDDEFLLIRVSASKGSVELQRDAYITMPLFYSCEKGTLTISNDFSRVVSHTAQRTVAGSALAEHLVALPFNWKSAISEIHITTERARVVWDGREAKDTLPQPRNKSSAQNPRMFKKILEHTLNTYWQRYGGQILAFELSGGIDSSIAPGYYAREYHVEPRCVTKVFPYEFGHTQTNKIQAFITTFHALSYTIPVDLLQHYPLRYVLEGGYKAPIQDSAEIYRDINREMAIALQQSGTTAVFTGIGGNELFESGKWAQQIFAGKAEKERRRAIRPAYFYTDKFREQYQRSIEAVPATGIPKPLCATSALHAGLARNNIYLEQGIWPVSPLANPRLYDFTQGLEARYMDNKNIMRAYAAAAGYPESIYNPQVNENAGPFFEQGVLEFFPKTAARIIENSRLAEEELVDLAALSAIYSKVSARILPKRALFDLYNFVSLEHNLQTLRPKLKLL